MPKKGGKKKNKKNSGPVGTKRVLIYKGDMEEYAQMTKMLGDRRIIVMLPDKTETMAIIPGRFRKRCWIKVGDVLILSRRDFQDAKLDVIYKYNDEETRRLAKENEIPEFFLDASMPDGGRDNDDENFLWEDSDEEPDEVAPPPKKLSYEDIKMEMDAMISDI